LPPGDTFHLGALAGISRLGQTSVSADNIPGAPHRTVYLKVHLRRAGDAP
jgi:hypothetical protein